MRITCPSCGAQYDVEENDISFSGQDVQCSECDTIWFQKRDGSIGENQSPEAEPAASQTSPQTDSMPTPEDPTPWEEISAIAVETNLDNPGEATPDQPVDAEIIPEPVQEVSFTESKEPIEQPASEAGPEPLQEETPEVQPQEEYPFEGMSLSEFESEEVAITSSSEPDYANIQIASEPEIDQMPETDAGSTDEEEDIDLSTYFDEEPAEVDLPEISEPENVKTPETHSTGLPPIQEAPFVVSDAPVERAEKEDFKPWEDSGDNNDEIEDKAQTGASIPESSTNIEDTGEESEETAEVPPLEIEAPATSDAKVNLKLVADNTEEEFDEDALLETFRSQIEIEDTLEKNPPVMRGDTTPIPEELIGRRARVPDLDGLKSSFRGSAEADAEAHEYTKPRRRFRRGFILTMVFFTLLAAIYVLSGQIVAAVPSLAPVMKIYVAIGDAVRNAAAGIGGLIWSWIVAGYDWVLAKINGS